MDTLDLVISRVADDLTEEELDERGIRRSPLASRDSFCSFSVAMKRLEDYIAERGNVLLSYDANIKTAMFNECLKPSPMTLEVLGGQNNIVCVKSLFRSMSKYENADLFNLCDYHGLLPEGEGNFGFRDVWYRCHKVSDLYHEVFGSLCL